MSYTNSTFQELSCGGYEGKVHKLAFDITGQYLASIVSLSLTQKILFLTQENFIIHLFMARLTAKFSWQVLL